MNRSKQSSEMFGDSYATMGDSFMGESFANMGEHSFAVGNGCEYSFDFEDNEDDNELEVVARSNLRKRMDLATVLDLEEEEDDEVQDSSSKDGDSKE
jgi:hypothetical protein